MKKLSIIFFIVIIGLMSVTPVFAQSPTGDSVTLNNPIESETISGIIDSIIVGLRDRLAPPLVALMVLVGAFQMLFAGGNPDKFSTGKKTIIYAIAGYVIIIVASGISGIIAELVS
ncbi:MAG: TrbC/VirB2 family protein [Candidatus Paceibacterota bacterium]